MRVMVIAQMLRSGRHISVQLQREEAGEGSTHDTKAEQDGKDNLAVKWHL